MSDAIYRKTQYQSWKALNSTNIDGKNIETAGYRFAKYRAVDCGACITSNDKTSTAQNMTDEISKAKYRSHKVLRKIKYQNGKISNLN